MKKLNVAIDGPAGAGKSTIAKAVAKELGILYLDTGAMYRAMGLKALRSGFDPGDRVRVLEMLKSTEVTAVSVDGAQHTLLDGEDVSALIRTQQVSAAASAISAIPEVRTKLVDFQKRIALENDVVMEGRDMGSCVIPETKDKFFVTASVSERAKRRLLELRAKGLELEKSIADIEREIEERDYADSHREFAPLTRMPDAVLVDTTDMSIEEATRFVSERIGRRG